MVIAIIISATKTIDINIRTRADTKEAQDLKKMLESMENVEVKVNAEDSNIQKAQKDVDKLNGYTANINVDVEGDKEIDAVDKKIGTVNGKSVTIPVTVEGEEQLDAVDEKVGTVNGKSVTIPVTVEGEEQLDAVDEKIGQLNGKPVNIPVNTNSSSLDGLTNKIMGVAGGIAMADEATRMWTASTQRQSNEVYLASKMGTEKAKEMGSAIQKIVAQVPGDDTFMNTLLTGSLAKQTDLTTSQLKQQANVMADYLSMSQAQGKNALEAQQDLKSYILSSLGSNSILPTIYALLSITFIKAPTLDKSLYICIRDSKICSTTVQEPLLNANNTPNNGCISVGKNG